MPAHTPESAVGQLVCGDGTFITQEMRVQSDVRFPCQGGEWAATSTEWAGKPNSGSGGALGEGGMYFWVIPGDIPGSFLDVVIRVILGWR